MFARGSAEDLKLQMRELARLVFLFTNIDNMLVTGHRDDEWEFTTGAGADVLEKAIQRAEDAYNHATDIREQTPPDFGEEAHMLIGSLRSRTLSTWLALSRLQGQPDERLPRAEASIGDLAAGVELDAGDAERLYELVREEEDRRREGEEVDR